MATLDIDKRNGSNDGRDWTSLKAWSQAIGIIGIPGAIAIFLVYVGATEIPKMTRQQEVLLQETKATQAKLDEIAALLRVTIRIAQSTCLNSARDDNARQRCFDIR